MLGIRFGAFAASGAGGGGGAPTRSLSFVAASTQYLSMSSANWGSYNRAKWAYSCWFNTSTGNVQFISKADQTNAAASEFYIKLNSGAVEILSYSGAAADGELRTTATTFADGNWHNLLFWFDSANATAGNRMQLWLDGTKISSFSVQSNPTGAVDTTAELTRIGAIANDPASDMDGLIYQSAFYSGTLPSIGAIYNAGSPLDVSGISGLYSLLNTNATDPLTQDFVLATAWTNNNTVTKSSTIP
jgi:hypothetical protein